MLLAIALAAAAPWSTDPADLDPAFRARVERVIAVLEGRGYTPHVGTTWRDPRVQDAIHAVGNATNAAGGQSCHNVVDAAGRPAARAIDLWNAPMGLDLFFGATERLAAEAPFLKALGEAAKREGLRWGGDWRGRESAWAAFGLGWDPAHLETGACRS